MLILRLWSYCIAPTITINTKQILWCKKCRTINVIGTASTFSFHNKSYQFVVNVTVNKVVFAVNCSNLKCLLEHVQIRAMSFNSICCIVKGNICQKYRKSIDNKRKSEIKLETKKKLNGSQDVRCDKELTAISRVFI